jgi:hypothetical protein
MFEIRDRTSNPPTTRTAATDAGASPDRIVSTVDLQARQKGGPYPGHRVDTGQAASTTGASGKVAVTRNPER